jgi:hypothetical protein
MNTAVKIFGVFASLLGLAAGVWVTLTTALHLDFYSIFFIPGMSSAESLYFNMIMFVLGVAALMFVIPMLLDKKPESVEFPTIFALIPLVISAINIIFAFSLDTAREKIIVILSAVIYFFLVCTIIYNGAKLFSVMRDA